jgi:peptidyl-prolyl cis-trans isomerase C
MGIIIPMFSQPPAGIPTRTAKRNTQLYGACGTAIHPQHILSCLLLPPILLTLSACTSFSFRPTPTPPRPTATPAPPTATPEPAAFTVNGEAITAREFTAQLAQYKAAQTSLGKVVSDQGATTAVLDDLISQVLLAQAAREAGFVATDSVLKARLDSLQGQVGGLDKLAKWEQDNGYPTPVDFRVALKRSVEAAWMRDKIVSAVPKTADQVHVQQILLYNEANANAVLGQLKGGADFNTLATQYDPNTRGDLGWFPRGYLLEPKIEEAAFSLLVGESSGVIQTDAGYSIIEVLEHDPNHPLSPDAYLALQQLALQDWIAKARAAAKIVLAP